MSSSAASRAAAVSQHDRQRTLHKRVEPLLKRLGVDFTPTDLVENLSIAQRQMVEIAKALSLNARVIIMDEPTSSLTLTETDRLSTSYPTCARMA
jgi:ABC-type sugar transport system ATPase subunit